MRMKMFACLSVSHWVPVVAHMLRVLTRCEQPSGTWYYGEFTEIEGQKRSSAWC